MARRSPVEVDARRLAVIDLQFERKYARDQTAAERLTSSADTLAREAARYLVAGDVPKARRYARAHQLVNESRVRLRARHTRERDAKRAREEAVHGITVDTVVRTTRSNALVPAGTVCTVVAVSGACLYAMVDGVRRMIWAADVERVAPEPAVVLITREKVRPVRVRPGVRYLEDGEGPYHWTYNYTVDGGPLCQYGPGLQSLMDMLKSRQPGATVEQSWAVSR